MTGRRSGLLGQMWQNIKKSLLIYRTNDLFMGSDQHGNRYFERPEGLPCSSLSINCIFLFVSLCCCEQVCKCCELYSAFESST